MSEHSTDQRKNVLRVACVSWRDDGAWDEPWAECAHVRMEIGLPIETATVGKIATCPCGGAVVVLAGDAK